jgi:hypothetical protein
VVNQVGPGLDMIYSICDDGWYATGEFEIYNNVFINCGLNGVYPGQDYRSEVIHIRGQHNLMHVKLYNNVIYDYGDPGTYVGAPIHGNAIMVWDNYGGDWNFAGTWEFKNNIIFDRKNIEFTQDRYMKAPSSSGHNIWYSAVNGELPPPSWDSSPLSVNPLFVNASAGNFSLRANSPAVDAGDNSVLPIAAKDFFGITRPQGNVCDIGAFEYGQGEVGSYMGAPRDFKHK